MSEDSAPIEPEIVDEIAESGESTPLGVLDLSEMTTDQELPQELLDAIELAKQQATMQQTVTTAMDLFNRAVMPQQGTPLQLIACQTCQQPLLLTIAQTVNGQFITLLYCMNSLCESKRVQRIVPATAGMPAGFDPRRMRT